MSTPIKKSTVAQHERRATAFEIRTSKSSDKNTAYGSAIVYNSRSEFLGFYEVILPGAVSESLRTNDQFCYFNHDSGRVLGRKSSGTLEFQDSKTALNFTVDLPNTPDGVTVRELVARRDIHSCSFGFTIPDGGDEWTELPDGNLLRTINKLTLYECSIVAEPAYTATSVSLRSLPKHLRAKLKQKTKKVDGVELPSASFAYVGDKTDPETWKLPIEFPSDEAKTVSHIKDALARFDQTDGIPESEKAKVYDRIVAAAKAHGITVSKETYGRSRHVPGMLTDSEVTAFLGSDGDDDSDSDSHINADDDDDDDDLDCDCRCYQCAVEDRCDRCLDDRCEERGCVLCPAQTRAAHLKLLQIRAR